MIDPDCSSIVLQYMLRNAFINDPEGRKRDLVLNWYQHLFIEIVALSRRPAQRQLHSNRFVSECDFGAILTEPAAPFSPPPSSSRPVAFAKISPQ